jgi:hypothetical protein
MTRLARPGTISAALGGACVAIATSAVLPLSAALTCGMLLTIAVRRKRTTRTYGTLSGGLMLLLVGSVLGTAELIWGAERIGTLLSGVQTTDAARLLVGLAGGGFVLHEVLVRTDDILSAGSAEAAGRHRYWTGPTTFVVMCIAGLSDAGLLGTGRYVALGAVCCSVCAHSFLAFLAAPRPLLALSLSLSIVSLLGLSMVADGVDPAETSRQGSVVDRARRLLG